MKNERLALEIRGCIGVDEEKHLITIARIIYSGRDYEQELT